jgi:serine/threonine protein kinase
MRFESPFGPWPVLDCARGARFASLLAAETWIGQRLSKLEMRTLSVARASERRMVFLQPVGSETFILHSWTEPRRERVPSENLHSFLNLLNVDGFKARSCATCSYFSFSGMSRDMSAGTKGYCGQRLKDAEAALPEQAVVSIFDLCAHRRRKPSARSRYADLDLADRDGRRVVIKVARHAAGPIEMFAACEARFTSGLVVFGDPDPDDVIRCEANALTALAPATPSAIESGVLEDGRSYVVREFVEGETWRDILDRGGRVEVRSLRKLIDLLATIEESTDLGYHGDVKPDNIISTPSGDVVLIDPTSAFTRNGKGGSPQRALLTGEYNPRLIPSDHAATALTLIEMMTGRQLIAHAGVSPVPRPISDRLKENLRLAASTGRDRFARLLAGMAMPSEVLPSLDRDGPAEALLLRCLGLSFRMRVLDTGMPLASLRELDDIFRWIDDPL